MERETNSLKDWIDDRLMEADLESRWKKWFTHEICRQWDDGVEITIIITKNSKENEKET